MRIVILGDFHLTPAQPHIADEAMDDINLIRPDLVVPLGDFGSGDKIGSPEGLEEAWNHLRRLDAPLRPILGNHDLQEESAGRRTHYSMLEALREISGVEAGGGFLEFDDFRLMFATTDPQSADSCWTVQECYVATGQFQQLEAAFKRRRGIPVVAFTHAPPIGCSLRTVPTVHVRCTNAYLDQNHEAYRWERLYREHPEFVMWFSAHYHLGHDHPDSMTNIDGTNFFQTQIHGLQTRDQTRASRVLDITADSITVSTLDHVTRRMTPRSQWKFEGSFFALMEQKRQILAEGRLQKTSFAVSSSFLPGCLKPLSDDRLLIGTDDGFLWEAELSTRSILGTLHIGLPLSGVALTRNYVWRSWDNTVVRVSRDNLSRFIREKKPKNMPGKSYLLEEPIHGLVEVQGDIFVLGTQHLWGYSPEHDRFQALFPLPAPPALRTACVYQHQVAFTDIEGNRWQQNHGAWRRLSVGGGDTAQAQQPSMRLVMGENTIAITDREIRFLTSE